MGVKSQICRHKTQSMLPCFADVHKCGSNCKFYTITNYILHHILLSLPSSSPSLPPPPLHQLLLKLKNHWVNKGSSLLLIDSFHENLNNEQIIWAPFCTRNVTPQHPSPLNNHHVFLHEKAHSPIGQHIQKRLCPKPCKYQSCHLLLNCSTIVILVAHTITLKLPLL